MALNELEVLLPNYEDVANQIEQFREEVEEINEVAKIQLGLFISKRVY